MLQVFQTILSTLEKQRIPYMIVGSVASIVYGEPRLTKDMNVVVDIAPGTVADFCRTFSSDEFYCPPIEVIRDEVVRRGQFNLIHQLSGLKIDLVVRKDTEHAKTEFSRRRKIPLGEGFEAYIAAPEDVILKKLAYYREGGSEKHLLDIRGILSQTEIDKQYFAEWLAKLMLQEMWAKVND